MTREAEVRVMRPPIKKYGQTLDAGKGKKIDSPSGDSKKNAALTTYFQFLITRTVDNTFVFF